jgi:hypothetical protein
MSIFKYSLFINDQHKADYTSINHFLSKNIDLYIDENNEFPKTEKYLPLIKAYKVKPFTKRFPQVYEDKSRGFRLESSYIEMSVKLNTQF